MSRPYFAAEIPAGTYGIRLVEDPSGSPTNIDFDIVVPANCFWVPDTSVGTTNVKNIWFILTAALTVASGASGNGWTYSLTGLTTNKDRGLAVSLSSGGGGAFKLDQTNYAGSAANGVFGESWLGYDPDPDSGITTLLPIDFQPKGTWFPKCHWSFEPHELEPVQVKSSGSTADGSEHTTAYDDGVLKYWRTFQTAGGDGVHRARIDPIHLNSTVLDWGDHEGMSVAAGSRKAWVALGGTDGWWQRTVGGSRNFICVENEEDVANSIEGIYRISYASTNPVSMDDWKGLRNLGKFAAIGGRTTVRFGARYISAA